MAIIDPEWRDSSSQRYAARSVDASARMLRRTRYVQLGAIFVAALLAVLVTYLVIAKRVDSALFSVVLGGVVGLTVAALAGAAREVTRRRDPTVRVALAGFQGAGKTVYAHVLNAILIEARGREIAFTPEIRTARSSYASIGILSKGEWPTSTTDDNIVLRRGTVEKRRQTFLSTLIFGRARFFLEIADSAGELWSRVAGLEGTQLQDDTRASSFFAYVADCDVLVYFIDGKKLFGDPAESADAINGLLEIVQLLRAASLRPDRFALPVAVVFTKADLLSDGEHATLYDWVTAVWERHGGGAGSPIAVPKSHREAFDQMGRLMEVLASLTPAARPFIVSALAAAVEAKLLSESTARGLVKRSESAAVRPHFRPDALWAIEATLGWPLFALGRRRSR